MSASLNVVRWRSCLLRLDAAAAAIRWRIALIRCAGLARAVGAGVRDAAVGAGAARRALARLAGAAGSAACCAASTSPLVTRPPRPVPVDLDGVDLRLGVGQHAARPAATDRRRLRGRGAAAGRGGAPASSLRGGRGAGRRPAACASGRSAPTTAPMATVSPSCDARSSGRRRPGRGPRCVALSVSSSKSGSSAFTAAPSGLSQRQRRPR